MAIVEKYVTHDASGGDGSSGSPWTLAEAAANASAGQRINVKAGAYTLGSRIEVANDGNQTNAIMWRGYKTSIGDLFPHRSGSHYTFGGRDRDTGMIDTSDMPQINVVTYGRSWDNDTNQHISGLYFYGSVSAETTDFSTVETGGSNNTWIGCVFKTTVTTGSSSGNLGLTQPASAVEIADANSVFVDCDFICQPSSSPSNPDGFRCATISGNRVTFHYCRFYMAGAATGACVQEASAPTIYSHCVFDGNGTAKAGVFSATAASAHAVCMDSTFRNFNGPAIKRDDGDFDDTFFLSNSIISDATYIFDSDYSGYLPFIIHNCRTRDIANATTSVDDFPGDGSAFTTDTGTETSDFHNPTSQDIRPVPGSTNGWNQGLWREYTGVNNIGAYQSRHKAAKSGVPRTYHT